MFIRSRVFGVVTRVEIHAMNSVILLTITVHLLPWFVWCRTDSLNLINQLNAFYRFDHNIFLIDSSIDLDHWLPISSTSYGSTPQTIYTFGNPSQQISLKAPTSKNTFIIGVVDELTVEWWRLFRQVLRFQALDVNMKIGVFFVRNIESSDNIKKLFRLSWIAGIVNIFGAFQFSIVEGESSFNIFKYDPYGTIPLVNVTGNMFIKDYFNGKMPNYRKHPIKFVTYEETINSVSDVQFWETIVSVFNASISQVNISFTEALPKEADVLPYEQRNIEKSAYPHSQSLMLLIVPHAKPYSDFLRYLQNLPGTWTLFFVFIFIVIAMSSMLLTISGYVQKKKILLFQCVADVVYLLLNNNSAIRYQKLSRVEICVIVPLTFKGLIVMNGILSIFQSYIMSPNYQPQINSIEDLYVSSVRIHIPSEMQAKDKIVKLLEDHSKHGDGWNDKVHEILSEQLSHEIFSLNVLMSDQDAKNCLDVQKQFDLKIYHVIRDSLMGSSLLSYGIRLNFPFIEHIKDITHRLNGAGLIDKWARERDTVTRDILWNKQRQIKDSKKLDMSEFTVPTVIWCGWIASVIVFVCEIIWYKLQKSRMLTLSRSANESTYYLE